MKKKRNSKSFLHRHSLSLAALGVVILLIVLYCQANPGMYSAPSPPDGAETLD